MRGSTMMTSELLNWRRALHAGFVVSIAVWSARAMPEAASPPRLGYSGVLRDASGAAVRGPVQLRFRFRQGAAVICEPTVKDVWPDASDGAFDIGVDISSCPPNLLDGTPTTFDVEVNGAVLAKAQPVGAAPYARYADASGTPECPPGYSRTPDPNFLVCIRDDDEVVRVGSGATAFWIDRYEASIWDKPSNPTKQYGTPIGHDDYPSTFPDDGQYDAPVFALSRRGAKPSTYINWLQAQAACEASGKRLPTIDEWFEAVRAVPDPGSSSGAGETCITSATDTRPTGQGAQCRSAWGAEDMVGNFFEWTDSWFVSIGDGTPFSRSWPFPGGDGSWNIVSSASNGTDYVVGLPGTARMGGANLYGDNAGAFNLEFHISPAMAWPAPAARCVIPR